MCRYRVIQYRCNHKLKTVLPPCTFSPACTSTHADLNVLTKDLHDVRLAIRLHNTDRNSPAYTPAVAHIWHEYAAFFGWGSGHVGDQGASLRDVERYLEQEVDAVATNVVERIRSDDLCEDGCFEGLVLLGRDEVERGQRR